MRLLLVTCSLASLVGVAGAQAPQIPFKSRELQEGKNYIQSQTTPLSIGESSGQVSATVAVGVPPGRGITPTVELQYSSSAGLSEFGYGWDLSLPLIERSNRTGAPLYDFNRDKFHFRNGHQTAELEFVQVEPSGWALYRERTDHSFNRYLYLNNTWRILTPNGLRYELGLTPNSRRGTNRSIEIGTAAWLVDKISDAHTNYAAYDYTNDPTGNPRIFAIRYTGNDAAGVAPVMRVDFVWVPHWTGFQAPFSFRSGYKRVFGQDRLDKITVTAAPHATGSSPAQIPANSPTARDYTFTYAPALAPDRVFYLLSAKEGPFPPRTFTYSATPPDGTVINGQRVMSAGGDPRFPRDMGLSKTENGVTRTLRVVADLNSDGRADILEAPTDPFGNYIAWLNTGSDFRREEWPAITQLGDEPPDRTALRVVTSNGVESITDQDFIDLNGDGYPDIVYVFQSLVRYCPGNGMGFDACKPYSEFPGIGILRRDTIIAQGLTTTDVDLVDVNGDGLVDSLRVNGNNLIVRINRGGIAGFAGQDLITSAPFCDLGIQWPSCLRVTATVVATGNNDRVMWVEVKDINGDGVPDYLHTNPATPSDRTVSFGRLTRDGLVFDTAVPIDLDIEEILEIARDIAQRNPKGN